MESRSQQRRITNGAVSIERLRAAYEAVRRELLAARNESGHWVGELATSALSTATAVSALSIVRRDREKDKPETRPRGHSSADDREDRDAGGVSHDELTKLIRGGLDWLARHANSDGGFGDTDRSHSNIATTMLVVAAFHLAGEAERHAELIRRAEAYVDRLGRTDGLRRRYGRDKTFAVPILTNAALAGLVPWSDVSPLPFEAACLPQSFYRFVRLPVVSYAIPALVAIGQARYFHRPPWNPLMRAIRAASVEKSLDALLRMQPASGGYLEAVPLTSFVVMSLAATGRAGHAVTRSGVRFLIDSVRPDGSWPIDTNLATWNTTLSINALGGGGEDVGQLGASCLDWLLGCQYAERHPFTGAAPGGWGWSDLSGAVPDADDTPGALLALAAWRESPSCRDEDHARIDAAAKAGLVWLLDLQNRDGGWPTFCRGWGKLPFDRSGADLTAHVLRAIEAWSRVGRPLGERFDPRNATTENCRATVFDERLAARAESAAARGWRYLARQQRPDGSWTPLWFGNQDHADEENPVYGTAKVLAAYRDANRLAEEPASRAIEWLLREQNGDGGWGGGESVRTRLAREGVSSVEETALALEVLLSCGGQSTIETATMSALGWLVEAVERGWHRASWPIGFYFAKLWYYEKLYPLVFSAAALGRACRVFLPAESLPPPTRLTNVR